MDRTLPEGATRRLIVGAALLVSLLPGVNNGASAQITSRADPLSLGQTPAARGDATDMPSTEQLQRGALRREAAQSAADASAARINSITKNPEAWRYRYHNGRWWYYTPERRWMVRANNQWTYYRPQPPLPPRYNTGYRGPYRYGYYDYRPGFVGPSPIRQVNPPPVDNFGPAKDTINGTDAEAVPGSIGHGVGAGDSGANTGAPH